MASYQRSFGVFLLTALVASTAVAPASVRGQAPARDTPSQPSDPPQAASGRITGRVLAADTGRPVSRARVLITAQELGGGRATVTDDSGAFDFAALPAGRYTVAASKVGFVGLSYGQRRPLQGGTPLQLAGGQHLRDIEFRLPRGSAIAGRIYDEAGEPMAGTTVRVMRYQYAQGNRQLVPAGGAQTDDRGSYRVWGLNPGDYYVSAVTPNFNPEGRGGRANAPGLGRGRGAAGAGALGGAQAGLPDRQSDPDQVGYAPTFYPGVPSVNDARAVNVGLGGEALDIDFTVLLVRTTRIAGRVTSAEGNAVTRGIVNLVPDGQTSRAAFGPSYGGRIQADGAFTIANVPPGRYMLRARGEDARVPQFAAYPLTVAGGEVADLVITLAAGGSISGSVTLQATQSAVLPDPTDFRIAVASTDFGTPGAGGNTRVDKDGTFTVDGVPVGSLWIRSQAPRGWMLKSVIVGGREVIDTPFEVAGGQKISGVSLVFTDKLSEINGTVTDQQGSPVTELTVLAFPVDSDLWRPPARHIMTARPDQNGRFQIRGLPAGEYFLATIDPVEQGEWLEPSVLDVHRAGASRLLLGDGEVKTQDFRISAR